MKFFVPNNLLNVDHQLSFSILSKKKNNFCTPSAKSFRSLYIILLDSYEYFSFKRVLQVSHNIDNKNLKECGSETFLKCGPWAKFGINPDKYETQKSRSLTSL